MYKTINGWTKAKMLKHVKDNFTVRSVDPDTGDCVYRHESKGKVTKCAVGLFIPDEVYDVEMEDELAVSVIDIYGLELIMPLSPDYMDSFQSVHDKVKTGTKKALLDWIKKNVA